MFYNIFLQHTKVYLMWQYATNMCKVAFNNARMPFFTYSTTSAHFAIIFRICLIMLVNKLLLCVGLFLNRTCHADQLDPVCRFLEDVEAQRSGQYGRALCRDCAGCVEDISGKCLIAVVLGDFEAETLVDIRYLAAARELIDAGRHLACRQA